MLIPTATKLPGRYPDLALDPTSPWALYTGAALAVPAIVPYTLGIMKPTNDRLHRKVREPESMTESETRRVIGEWKVMNYKRGMFAFTGMIMGAIAVVTSS